MACLSRSRPVFDRLAANVRCLDRGSVALEQLQDFLRLCNGSALRVI